MSRVYWCRRCRNARAFDDVIEVVAVKTGQVTYLCRPTYAECFTKSSRARSEERIAAIAEQGQPRD